MKNSDMKHTLIGCVVGLVLAVAVPFLLPLSAILSVATVALVVLYAWCGAAGAAFAAAACCISAGSVFGAIGVYAVLGVAVLPAAVGIVLIERRAKYGARMKGALIAQVLGAAAFLLAAQITVGGDLADALTGAMYEQISAMPAGFVDYYLIMQGAAEMPQNGMLDLVNGILTEAEREARFMGLLESQNQMLKVNIPPMIAFSCIYTGVLACHLPSRVLSRKGMDIEHLPLHKWRLGKENTLLLIALFATSIVFMFVQSDVSLPAYSMLQMIANIGFSLQGLAAVARMLVRAGHPGARRGWMLTALFAVNMMAANVLMIVGFASSMWGSEGIITQKRKKKLKDMGVDLEQFMKEHGYNEHLVDDKDDDDKKNDDNNEGEI